MRDAFFIRSAMGNALAECPFCGRTAEAATSVSKEPNAQPEPGGITVCAYCFAIGKYDARLMIIPLEPGELEQLKENPHIWPIISEYRKRKGDRRG